MRDKDKIETEEIKQIAKARRNKSSDNLPGGDLQKQKESRPRQRSNDSSTRPSIKLNLKDLKKDQDKEKDNDADNKDSPRNGNKSPKKSPKTRASSVTSSNSLTKDSPKCKYYINILILIP
jgi:hypothetical protein